MGPDPPGPRSLALVTWPVCPVLDCGLRKETAAMPPRLTSISADLGTLKAPWVAWCAKQQITPSDALRQIIGRPSARPLRVVLWFAPPSPIAPNG